MPGKSSPAGGTGVRVVVAGDRGTGKSSLIAAAATESFPENVPSVLPPTRLPTDYYPDRVPITIIDTSSSLENRVKLLEELKRADAVVLTYACDQPMTLNRLTTFWLQELRKIEVRAPVIVVGCKLDLRDEQEPTSLEQIMAPIMQQFREIETCIECSAATLIQIPEVFYYAQRAVLHPTAPLFDQEAQTLKPRYISALKRIFILCDHDMDGALNDSELSEFQVKCFNEPLKPAEIIGVKRLVQEKLPSGVNQLGLTLDGFLLLHALFIEKGRLEAAWAVLRKFGYDDDLKLRADLVQVPFKCAPDQSVEMKSEAIEFLSEVFRLFDTDGDGTLDPSDIDELFSTAPERTWDQLPYKDCTESTRLGSLKLRGFFSKWALMTRLDPSVSLANLIYLGYDGTPASALHVTRRRSADRKKQKTERNIFQCFVFGPKSSGKSALLEMFRGSLRRLPEDYISKPGERYAVNVVEQLGGYRKTLVLREISEDEVTKSLSNKEFLAACDVAVFLYDRSDEFSWKRARELLLEVARHGEESGYGVPCLLVATKHDLVTCEAAVQQSLKVCQELGIEPPLSVSAKLGDQNNIYNRIVSAAERPHLNIPETEAGRISKQYRRLVNRSLMCVSVGTAMAVVGLAVYRAYAARKNTAT